MAASPLSPQRKTTNRRHATSSRPQRLGQWVLLREIAAGNLATIHEARHASAPADGPANYVVKLVSEPNRNDPRAAAVLAREAEVGSAVSHPHLVPVLASQTQKPPYYVVEPRLVGCTASQLIVGAARPPLSVVVWIIRQTAEALDALYRGGWMHADVKPANIIVSPHGHATLLDLGFARRLVEGHSFVDRQVCGTPSYIAPELFTSRGTADIRSDIYSLGATLYELVTGTRPFEGKSLSKIAEAHLTTRPRDLRRFVPQVPDQLSQLVAEMLAKDPLRRPHTPAELIERLMSIEIATFAQRDAA